METLINIHYFDSILYGYLEHLLTEKPSVDVLTHYGSFIEVMHKTLKETGYVLEEEIRVKYILYLINEHVIKGFFKDDMENKLLLIVRHIQEATCETYNLIQLERIFLWLCNSVIGSTSTLEKSAISRLDQKHCREITRQLLERDPKTNITTICQRSDYYLALKSEIEEEIQKLFLGFSIPLLNRMNLAPPEPLCKSVIDSIPPTPPPQFTTLPELSPEQPHHPSTGNYPLDDEDMEMTAAELASLYISGVFPGMFLDTDLGSYCASLGLPLTRTYPAPPKLPPIYHGKRVITTQKKGEAVGWSDTENMDDPQDLGHYLDGGLGGRGGAYGNFKVQKFEHYPPVAASEQRTRAGRVPLRRQWSPKEVFDFIEIYSSKKEDCMGALQLHFPFLTSTQIKEKIKNLRKAGKLPVDSTRKKTGTSTCHQVNENNTE
ncbi:hypothetical protein NEDG_00872 [Nematocida displodere]|uniref:Uncharacterized protein n=1 Tax=Nematocida displodere TaxID=1805483 RepID=A0A177EFH0_9MICR|nr:hypothetical protein NEDG_00872 [Nematocida displodere]